MTKRPDFNPDDDLVPPNASSLTESLRAFGYDVATALADLADNSLFHHARKINIQFYWAGEKSGIAISDDGDGMDEQLLVKAMRVGSRNPKEIRDPKDLGRFGLGLKTASFSQCRRVTVITKKNRGNEVIRCWDLDHLAKINEWRLLRTKSSLAANLAKNLSDQKHGTFVVWENLDRLTAETQIDSDTDQDVFLLHCDAVSRHFSAVFHRLMVGPKKVEFFVNGNKIQPWDPFLIEHPATQQGPNERIKCRGQLLVLKPFILPHLSKLDATAHRNAGGNRGWNAHQGFYIYRNSRLLVGGDWLGIKGWKQEEHYKLARIRIDLPNALDQEWEIDVTKSRARPPIKLRKDLERIGERTRNLAKKVYSHRGATLLPNSSKNRIFLWDKIAKHNQVSYRLNRDHPLIKQVLLDCKNSTTFNNMLRLIEETIPIPLILITDREKPDQTVGPFEQARDSEILEIMRQVIKSNIGSGLSSKDALAMLVRMEPFCRFPHLLQTLTEVI